MSAAVSLRGLSAVALMGLALVVSGRPAEAQVFTDDPLQAGITTIRAVHITELRASINTQRASKGLSAFAWTDPTMTVGATLVRRVHVIELRTSLDDVYRAMGLPVPVYTDQSLVAGQTPIKAVHFNELRANVRAVPNCTYTVAPTTRTINHDSQTISFTLTTPAACAWTAQATSGFLTRTSAGSGSGSAQITYSATANPAFTTRTAQPTIAGQTVTVSQAGVGPTITGPANQLDEETWLVGVQITATDPLVQPITYSATGLPPGAIVDSASGLISGQLTSNSAAIHYVTVRATAGGRWSERIFRWLVRCPPADYDVTPLYKELSGAGGTWFANVFASAGCPYEATSNFVRIENGDVRMGDGTQQEVQFWIDNHPSPYQQAGLLTVAGQDVVLIQRGQEQATPCAIGVQPARLNVNADETGPFTLTFTPDQPNCQWAIAKRRPWVHLTGPRTGIGAGSITVRLERSNETVTRNGYVQIGANEIVIEQAADQSNICQYRVPMGQVGFFAGADTGFVDVHTGSQCAWTVTSLAPWITITTAMPRTGSGAVSFAVTQNTGAVRVGEIDVAGVRVTVTQAGSSSPDTYNWRTTSGQFTEDPRLRSLAEHWSPFIYQAYEQIYDKPLPVDFDGDWDTYTYRGSPLVQIVTSPVRVYYHVQETESIIWITYCVYHPLDTKFIWAGAITEWLGLGGVIGDTGDHQNDLEGMRVTIEKNGTPNGRLAKLESLFHNDVKTTFAPDLVGHRPAVYIEARGHGINVKNVDDLDWDDPVWAQQSVIFPGRTGKGLGISFAGRGAEVPEHSNDRDVSMDLIPLEATIWRQRGNGLTFSGTTSWANVSLGKTFRGRNGCKAKPPWNWNGTAWFYDPDLFLRELGEPPVYLYNPFLTPEAVDTSSIVSCP